MKPSLVLAFPDDIIHDIKDKQQQTLFISTIARSLAVFQINEIVFFKSPYLSETHRKRERKMLKTVLEYLETPQYLRKRIFPITHNLKYVGSCPPLATPHHQTKRTLKAGEIREGLVYLLDKKLVANVGAKYPIPVVNSPKRSFANDVRIRVPIRIRTNDQDEWQAEIIEPEIAQKKQYMGYKVKFSDASLSKYLKNRDKTYILTSAKGNKIEMTNFSKATELGKKQSTVIVFGSQNHGLLDFLKREGKSFKDVADLTINTWSNSGSRTIRLEEAIFISLARILPNLKLD